MYLTRVLSSSSLFSRSITTNVKRKLGELPKAHELPGYEERVKRFERTLKTELCQEFKDTGSCVHGSQCRRAHSLSELKPPVYFDLAQRFANEEHSPYITHLHLLEAQLQSAFKRPKGYKHVLDKLKMIKGVELESNVLIQYVPRTLLFEQMVEKTSLNIKVSAFQNFWFLTDSQVWALKQVVGPRYHVGKDSFKISRRNQRPYTEVLDLGSEYDANIKMLYDMVKEIRIRFPPHYVDLDNTPSIRATSSFTPEFVFDFDSFCHEQGDEFVLAIEDTDNATPVTTGIHSNPQFKFDMDEYLAPLPVETVNFLPSPKLTFSGFDKFRKMELELKGEGFEILQDFEQRHLASEERSKSLTKEAIQRAVNLKQNGHLLKTIERDRI